MVSGFLTWVGKTSHISDSDLISAGCYGSCVYERLGEPLGVCSGVKKQTWEGVLLGTLVLFGVYIIALLLFVTEGANHIIYTFLATLLALESTVICVIIWLDIKDSDINLRNVLSSVQVDSTGGLMLITMKMCL